MKKYNFYAGPSLLSEYTLTNIAQAVVDFEETGLSILEISHRSKEFIDVCNKTRSLAKELLNVSEGYEILFIGGGASMQFCMAPFNLLHKKASYLDTGTWASKAIKEAKFFGEVELVASSKDKNYCYIPVDYQVSPDSDYLHITTNNTIYGTQLHTEPKVSLPLVADMSSDIFSRPIDVSKYDLIYAGVQKNLAPSGMAIVIVRKEALGKADRSIPTILDYNTHIKSESMFNTPPVLQIYSTLKTLEYYKNIGGLEAVNEMNIKKAALLYDEIDNNKLFVGTANKVDRSLMNICFVMTEEHKELEKTFSDYALSKGIVGIKGHRSVGGFRASTYSSMPIGHVEKLVEAMRSFSKSI